MPHTGELRDRVRFEKRTETDDGYGNVISGDFAAQFTRKASIRPMKGGEHVIAQRLQGVQPVLITTRFDSSTKTITPDWRAVEIMGDGSERIYAIRSADDMEGRKRWWTIIAEAGVGS